MNHEDSLVISESLANKATYTSVDKVYIPIYEYTLMQEFYNDCKNSYTYFPGVGQQIKDDIICCLIAPKESATANHFDLKNKVQMALKNMSLSNLLSMNLSENSKFSVDKIKTKLENGTVTGIKIHRFKPFGALTMIDQKLEMVLDKLYLKYSEFISETYHDMGSRFHVGYVEKLLKKYYIYIDKSKGMRGEISLANLVYLIELEISKEDGTKIGDKLCNRSIGRFLE